MKATCPRQLNETQTHSYLHFLADLPLDGMSGFPAALVFRGSSFFHLWHRLGKAKRRSERRGCTQAITVWQSYARSRSTERATRKNARTRQGRRGLCYVTQHLESIQLLHPSSLQLPEMSYKLAMWFICAQLPEKLNCFWDHSPQTYTLWPKVCGHLTTAPICWQSTNCCHKLWSTQSML